MCIRDSPIDTLYTPSFSLLPILVSSPMAANLNPLTIQVSDVEFIIAANLVQNLSSQVRRARQRGVAFVLENISLVALQWVNQYLVHHANDQHNEAQNNLWDQHFILTLNEDIACMPEIMMAADKLGMNGLYQLVGRCISIVRPEEVNTRRLYK
ncbi:hypothetical protein OROMI_023912 [Orobanche minor]